MTFFCIADKDSSLGFKLCGVQTQEAGTPDEARQALKIAQATAGVGVILVTEKVASFIREEIDQLLYANALPLVLEIPSRGQESKLATAGEFLKNAIGITV